MNKKLNRNYELYHYDKDGNITLIKPPITIEFDIDRKKFGMSNVGSIRIYNLDKANRERIRHDYIDFDLNTYIILKAGYGSELSVILEMTVNQAWSVREGVNFITEIQCLDGAFGCIQAEINLNWAKDEPQRKVLTDMLDVFLQYGMKKGAIGNQFNGMSLEGRGNAYSGNAIEIVNQVTGGAAFVDNNIIHVLSDQEHIAGDTLLVSKETGLLGTPVREGYWVNFDMIFEPMMGPGRLINLQTDTGDKNMNGLYIVHALHHRGMISPNISGSVITSVSGYPGGDFPVNL